MDNIQTETAQATTSLEIERLISRRFEPADFDAYAAYRQNEEVYRFLYREAPKCDALRAAFDAQLGRSFEADHDALHLAVVTKEGGDLVGEVILKLASREARQGEVGYIFNPRFAGKGYATEALRRPVHLPLTSCIFSGSLRGWMRKTTAQPAWWSASSFGARRAGLRVTDSTVQGR